LEKVAQRVDDKDIMHLVKLMLKASGKKGVPQGGVIAPRTQKVTSALIA
jgi:RNA-directed DNA polymerase